MSNFVAIDFETADYGRDSACSVGIVKVVKEAHGDFLMPLFTSHIVHWSHPASSNKSRNIRSA